MIDRKHSHAFFAVALMLHEHVRERGLAGAWRDGQTDQSGLVGRSPRQSTHRRSQWTSSFYEGDQACDSAAIACLRSGEKLGWIA